MNKSREPVSGFAVSPWIVDGLNRQLGQATDIPKHRRVYQCFREWILAGRLIAGTRLPSSRRLAQTTDMGRNTALAAIDQLIAEGFLVSREGSGVYVAELGVTGLSHNPDETFAAPDISYRGAAILDISVGSSLPSPAFALGMPALDLFPDQQWQRVVRRHSKPRPAAKLHYRVTGGHVGLKAAITDYVRLARGAACDSDQILITRGTQHALTLVATLLADAGDTAWIEEPGYLGARAAFYAADLSMTALPVDEHGADVQAVGEGATPPRLIYTTPSNQYPRGVTLTLARRLELIEVARRHQAWIIEDDYDSELRYVSSPLACLQGLAGGAPVIYIGTFSKTLFPSLQLGYIVLPKTLVGRFRQANARLFREDDPGRQAALADFMESGEYARHIHRMRRAYKRRQDVLRTALAPAIRAGLTLSSGAAGLHLVVYLESQAAEDQLVTASATADVSLARLSDYFVDGHREPGLVLGYAGANEREITRAGTWLSDTWLSLSCR